MCPEDLPRDNYSKDKNLWHLSHEGLDLEDPRTSRIYEKPGFLELGVSPIDAPDTPTTVSVSFEAGVPVAVNGEQMRFPTSSSSSTSSAAPTASAFWTLSRTGSSA